MNWWRHVLFLEFRKILAYRFEFWGTFLGQTLVQLFIARALWQNIFESQNLAEMNGYSLEMMTLYYLIVPLGMRTISGENIGFLSREIYDGTFSRYLIYPLSFFQYKTITYLSYSFFYVIQLIFLFFIYKFFFSSTPFNFQDGVNLLLGSVLFLMAAFTYGMMSMGCELLALWVDNVWSLMVMMRFFTTFLGGGVIPLVFFPDWVKGLLVYTPFPYLISLPVRTVMGLTTSQEIITGGTSLVWWGLIIMTLVKLIWRKGQKNYSGVGI